MMDHPATKSSMADVMTNDTVYKDIGVATVEEAQDFLFELARTRIGPETVQQICAAMMQLYFGKGSEYVRCASPDALAALQLYAPLRVCCNLQRYDEHSEWACNGTTWGGSYGPYVLCLEAVEGLTLQKFADALNKYAGLFKHEMKLRGLLLKFERIEGRWPYSKYSFSLEPAAGIYVAR